MSYFVQIKLFIYDNNSKVGGRAHTVLLLIIIIMMFYSSQLAISQNHESYGLIFGFNTFLALAMQTALTAIVNSWLGLNSRTQVGS